MTPPDDDNGLPLTLTIEQGRARARAAAAAGNGENEAFWLRWVKQREDRAALDTLQTDRDEPYREKRRQAGEVQARVDAMVAETAAKAEAEAKRKADEEAVREREWLATLTAEEREAVRLRKVETALAQLRATDVTERVKAEKRRILNSV